MVLARLNTEIDFGVEQQISSRGFSSTERKISPNINRTDVGAFTDIGVEADKERAWSSGRSDKICYFTLKEYFLNFFSLSKSLLYSEEQYMNFYSYSLTPLILLNDIYNKVYAPSFKPSRLHMSTSLTDGLWKISYFLWIQDDSRATSNSLEQKKKRDKFLLRHPVRKLAWKVISVLSHRRRTSLQDCLRWHWMFPWA